MPCRMRLKCIELWLLSDHNHAIFKLVVAHRDDDASLHRIRISVKGTAQGAQLRSAHDAVVKAWVSRLTVYSVATRTPMVQLEFDSHDIEEGPRPGTVDMYYSPDSQLAQLIRDVEIEGRDGEVLLGMHICKPRRS